MLKSGPIFKDKKEKMITVKTVEIWCHFVLLVAIWSKETRKASSPIRSLEQIHLMYVTLYSNLSIPSKVTK